MKKTHGFTNASGGSKGSSSSGLESGLTMAEKIDTDKCAPPEAKKQQRPKAETIDKV